jgi:hypothetical protein
MHYAVMEEHPMKQFLFTLLTVVMLTAPFSVAPCQAATPVFVDTGYGTIADTANNLVWLKNANCFGQQSWASAMTLSSSLASGQCGLSDGSKAGDWHLPTIDELKSLICGSNSPVWEYNGCDGSNSYNSSGGGPFSWLKIQGFLSVQSNTYWSGSTYAGVTGYAWFVDISMVTCSTAIRPTPAAMFGQFVPDSLGHLVL